MSRVAFKIGSEVDLPQAEVVLGGHRVTIYPMSLKSAEGALGKLNEHLEGLSSAFLDARQAGKATEEITSSLITALVQSITQVPKDAVTALALIVNAETDEDLTWFRENVSLAEVMQAWSVIDTLNDFSLLQQRITRIIEVISTRLNLGSREVQNTTTGLSITMEGEDNKLANAEEAD